MPTAETLGFWVSASLCVMEPPHLVVSSHHVQVENGKMGTTSNLPRASSDRDYYFFEFNSRSHSLKALKMLCASFNLNLMSCPSYSERYKIAPAIMKSAMYTAHVVKCPKTVRMMSFLHST